MLISAILEDFLETVLNRPPDETAISASLGY